MIILPTQKRLNRRRDRLYAHLHSIIGTTSVHQVECIMRQIHSINLRLRIYFKDTMREANELFNDEDNDITTQDTITGEVCPTAEELAQIEEQIKTGEI